MTWDAFLQDWHGQLDRLSRLFPYAETRALVRFRGNRQLLADYIADTHHLTRGEGREAVDFRLLPGARRANRRAAPDHDIDGPPRTAREIASSAG